MLTDARYLGMMIMIRRQVASAMSKSRKVRPNPRKFHTVSRPELLVRGNDDLFRQFVHDTLAFATRIQAVRNALGNAIGLSGTQYTILIAIAREQEKNIIGVNEIARHLHFSPAFVTIEVAKLVKSKLVAKKENPSDRRRVMLTITTKAERLLQSLTAVQRPVNNMLFESLTAADFEQLRHKMVDLVESADRSLQLFELPSMDAK
jgi:DNA-binding MarR family transcriptional regulator